MNGDVKVFGLTPGTHKLPDIGMDVPMGVTVVIPGAKAYASKDLWRAIAQKCIFHLSSGPTGTTSGGAFVPNPELDQIRGQLQAITEENTRLREALASKASEPPPSIAPMADPQVQSKLDDIMSLLLAKGAISAGYSPGGNPILGNGLVSGDAPTFIPSTIKPVDVGTVQISTSTEESNGSGIGEASSALRKFRKGGG